MLLFDPKQLKPILEDYRKLVDLDISLHDADYKPLAVLGSGQRHFCRIIRENEDIHRACRKCDIAAFKHVEKTRQLYVYKCHMGLYEAVAPIIDDGRVIGFIMVGRILDEESIEYQWLRVRKLCESFGVCEKKYKDAFYDLRHITMDRIEAAARIMHACAAYLCYQKLLNTERSSLFEQIDSFILDNLSRDINQEVIRSRFPMSQSSLYKILRANTGTSLTGYIRKCRMKKMKDMLASTSKAIKDISQDVGIGDYNYCTRLFRQTYGISPSSYRKQQL